MKYNIDNIRINFNNYFRNKYLSIKEEPLLSDFFPTSYTSSGGPTIAMDSLYNISPNISNKVSVIQPCIRYWDIENIGDNSHLSFFEMAVCSSFDKLGKKDVINDVFNFLINKYNLSKNRFIATYYSGGNIAKIKEFAPDIESYNLWKSLGINETNIIGVNGSDGFVANQVEPIGGYKTELYYDLYPYEGSSYNLNSSRFLELVTSVSYEYSVNLNQGIISKLSNFYFNACGFGIERLECILNGDGNIWNTSNLKNLLSIANIDYNKEKIKIYIDTLRVLLFLFSSGANYLNGHTNKGRRWILNKYIRITQYIIHDIDSKITHDLLVQIMKDYKNYYPFIKLDIHKFIDWLQYKISSLEEHNITDKVII